MGERMTELMEDVQRIEESREAGKKAGAIAARRILMAYLNGKNVESLATLAQRVPFAKGKLTKHLDDDDGGQHNRAYWLAYMTAIEPAVAATQEAAQ